MSSSWPCLFLLVCFLITQTPVPVPGAVSAGSCATTYSNPDIVFSRPSNASRVATMFTMFWLYIAWFSRTALFEVGSKNGDFAKYGSTEEYCQDAIFRSRTQGFCKLPEFECMPIICWAHAGERHWISSKGGSKARVAMMSS